MALVYAQPQMPIQLVQQPQIIQTPMMMPQALPMGPPAYSQTPYGRPMGLPGAGYGYGMHASVMSISNTLQIS